MRFATRLLSDMTALGCSSVASTETEDFYSFSVSISSSSPSNAYATVEFAQTKNGGKTWEKSPLFG